MQSEHSPSYHAGSLLDTTSRGGAPSALVSTRGSSSSSSTGAAALDQSASGGGGVCNIAPRPKRPWDDISPATSNNETVMTGFMSKQPMLSGVATIAAAAATTARENCGSLAVEGSTSKGVVIDIVGGGASPMNGSATRGGGASGSIAPPSISATSTAAGSSSALSVARSGGSAGSEDDLTDSDEKSVIARLGEFTEMARRTAVHNEELSRELVAEKRRVVHTTRKLEQCSNTCAELRESLTLAQDTVIKLREHEMAWAERTATEMSLRAELCALKDEHSSVSSDAAVLKKRCEAFQLENTELGERFAAIAEEKRQVESRARRLLRSERCRSY